MDETTQRENLQSLLESIYPGVKIYYRPPGNLKIDRPCIIYEPKSYDPAFASSELYFTNKRYQVTFLSDLPGYFDLKLMFSLMSSGVTIYSNRSYISEDILHDVFNISIYS